MNIELKKPPYPSWYRYRETEYDIPLNILFNYNAFYLWQDGGWTAVYRGGPPLGGDATGPRYTLQRRQKIRVIQVRGKIRQMAVWAVVYNKWCSPWHRPCLRSPNSPNSYQVVFFYTRSILVKIKTIFIILSSAIVRVVVVVACCLFGSVWNIFYILYRYQFSPYWSWVRFKRPSCLVWRIVKYNSIIFFSQLFHLF